MRRSLIPNPPRPYLFPIQSILQPASIITPTALRIQLKNDSHETQHQQSQYHQTASNGTKKEPKFQEWKGSSTQDHAINRASRNDITDPEVEGVASGREERKQNASVADATKSSATTERDLGQNAKKAKQEFPKAPEPVIGMSDERGQKGH
ncbi:hypothetical protein UA08_00872 [Talaromyces atroroseus]|uniref:Uncharacterized protein n=1 Tax=Talaromyces atroroseus TaxID=1441469 RepID=A0A225AU78_TALAT|nr:hypothetical protein UA08_00872 [Talaromyces atroroseus]OKL64490.1 hypothetical protein UA08_00872 [Talaromyces atroroseus]